MLNWVEIREFEHEDGTPGGYSADLGAETGHVSIYEEIRSEVKLDKAPNYEEGWIVTLGIDGVEYQQKYCKSERSAKRWVSENEKWLRYHLEQLM